ncbi:glycosyltransferase family 2 protein [Aporhodopirellula rubra]
MLMQLTLPASEILVIDQTAIHDETTTDRMKDWKDRGLIRWIKQKTPSITKAMNTGLKMSHGPLTLFLDDDIKPHSKLIVEHSLAHMQHNELWATVGQVIQPWQKAMPLTAPRQTKGLRRDFDFPFHSKIDQDVHNVMAGNLCVHRERALSIGGFDENFQGAAFRFETEFARRVEKAGGTIRFLSSAGIDHLRVKAGGTRSTGSHLTSADPKHGIGDHYYAFLHGTRSEAWRYSVQRLLREVATKFHATHPWWIPVKMTGELRAMWGGCLLARKKRMASSKAD